MYSLLKSKQYHCLIPISYTSDASSSQTTQSRFFTKLDLWSAYILVKIKPNKWKTTFSTTNGHHQYQIMPYGFASAPSVFQCTINDVLRDYLGTFDLAYFDDNFILSPDYSNQLKVLMKLLQPQLYGKGEKCEFHKNHIIFLAYSITIT